MKRSIIQVEFPVPNQPQLLKVAAYSRVSSGKDAMLHSLSSQVSYYSKLIQEHPGWVYCGVYADEAVTGTKERRNGFQTLLSNCRDGKIDLVITKSISRLARNTVTLLQTVRELKKLGVDVYFEEQNIHTISSEGELMMTILASYAQEESRSASENQKWRIKKNFEEGIPWNGAMLGYRYKDEKYCIVPDEAELVKRIFTMYLDGAGYVLISNQLNEEGIASPDSSQWHSSVVSKVLHNYAYTGNLLLQTTFRENHITKRKCKNCGEYPQYLATDTHEAIIPNELFQRVQEEAARRAEKYRAQPPQQPYYPFTGKMVCALCGKHYQRKTTHAGIVWICSTYNRKGKKHCASKAVPELLLIAATTQVLGLVQFDPEVFEKRIDHIEVLPDNLLRYVFIDGTMETFQWKDRSRSESWTTEMRAAVGKKTRERNEERRASNG